MSSGHKVHLTSQSKVIPVYFQGPAKRPQRSLQPRSARQMAAVPRSECLAVALELEDIQEAMPLVDHATRAAEHRVLLALLGETEIKPRQQILRTYLYEYSALLTHLVFNFLSVGSAAGIPPSPATLDLLAKCFDSSARLNPTIDVVPLFPFVIESLAGI